MGRRPLPLRAGVALLLVTLLAAPLAALPSADTTHACRDSPDTVLFLAMDADDRIAGAPERTIDCITGVPFGDVRATWAPDGRAGAYFFGVGGAGVATADDAGAYDIGAGEDFTLLLWVRVDALQNGAKASVLSKGAPEASDAMGYALIASTAGDPSVKLVLRDEDHAAATFVDVDGDMLDGSWHHVAFSVDRDVGVRTFVDGEETAAAVEGTPIPEMLGDLSSPDPLTLGGAVVAGELRAPLFGYLDEVRLVMRALGTCEVRSLMLYPYDDGVAAGVDPYAPTPEIADALDPVCAALEFPQPPPPPVV